MGKEQKWPEVPEGLAVTWEGLRYEKTVPLTDEEKEVPGRLMVARMTRVLGIPFSALFGLSLLLAVLWGRPRAAILAVAGLVVFLLLGFALSLLLRYAMRSTAYIDRATFSGSLDDVPTKGRTLGILRRYADGADRVTVDVLPGGALFAVNGTVLRRERVHSSPVVQTLPGYESRDPGRLSPTERAELAWHNEKDPARYVWSTHFIIAGGFQHAGELSGRYKLVVWAAFLALFVILAAWLARRSVARVKDATEGNLDLVGDKRVLRHSRIVWAVDGKPAKWRGRPQKQAG